MNAAERALFDAPPLLEGRPDLAELDEHLLAQVLTRPGPLADALFALTGAGALGFLALIGWTEVTGTGLWGNDIPTAWAFPILCFVWWIGIGHAGTFISAVLLLMEQQWRSSINRLAEAMTLAALVCAGIYPLLHLGRGWYFFWLLPYPSTMSLWPQFRSPLTWDIAAILTYSLVSLLFFWLGLLPDAAAARDRTRRPGQRRLLALAALGWRGSADQWRHRKHAELVLAGLAAPLVVSVHSIVSFDFAAGIVAGWHSTLFPPYFVVGAVHSGWAMVLLLLIPIRTVHRLQDVVTERHLGGLGALMLTTALLLGYAYLVEPLLALYGGERREILALLHDRPFGPHAPLFWGMLVGNVLVPQVLWVRSWRRDPRVLLPVSAAVVVGMWLERFVLVVTSLERDWLPSADGLYRPTAVDFVTFAGSLALFAFLYLAFLRLVPAVPLAEVKALARREAAHG
jgi:molybdopterin-containing oxidoreductase family membrane subunit